MKKSALALMLAPTIFLTYGCSTLTGGGTAQSVTVMTYTADGKDLNEAKCELVNDVGNWQMLTPNVITINRSNKDLFVTCKKDSVDEGKATVISRTKGHLFGNIVFGGGIGAIIDHNNGSAYEYPPIVKIVMGKDQRIEENDQVSETKNSETK